MTTTAQPPAFKDMLRERQLEAEYGIPAATWRWWRHVEQGPRWFRVGKRTVFYRREDVEQWLREQYDKPEQTA